MGKMGIVPDKRISSTVVPGGEQAKHIGILWHWDILTFMCMTEAGMNGPKCLTARRKNQECPQTHLNRSRQNTLYQRKSKTRN